MRLLVRTVTLLVLSVGIAPAAVAATSHFITVTPSSGPAGSSLSIQWAGFTQCRTIAFTWAGSALATGSPGTAGTVTATAPADAKPGTYTIGAQCGDETASSRFTVTVTTTTATTPPPTTTTTTTPPPRTIKPTTTPTTTTRPAPTPTTTSATTTSAMTITTTTVPTTPATTSAPSVTDEPKPDGGLTLDHATIQPGDVLSASGTGCQPGHEVTLTSDGQQVGSARADANGAFATPVEFTSIQPGRHTVTADCGVVLTGVVDQAITSSSGDYSATLAVLVFFVLAGIVFVRFY